MFTEAFPKFENSKIIRALRAYFSSMWHVFVVAFLMTVSALFQLELPVYYCFAVISLLVCFFAEDMLGAVPLVCCAPMTIAIGHNPERYADAFFGDPSVVVQIIFCVAISLTAFIARLISMLISNPKRRMPRFTIGFSVLFAAYLLGGAFSAYYSKNTVLFGVMEAVAICFFYFYFYLTVNWKKAPKHYIATVFAAIGFALVIQILSMYFQEGVVVDGVVSRGRLFLGWGHYNYVGAITAMCVPAAFYFTLTQKHGWIFSMLATVIMFGVVFTQSRGSILFGGFIYLVCAVIVLIKTKKWERIFNLILFGVLLIALTVVCFVYLDALKKVFSGIFQVGAGGNGRFEKEFPEAWGYFCSYPLFGAGWGGKNWSEGYAFLKFFKAHNTVLQMLGSLGIFGFVAYCFHRTQTCVTLFRHPTTEKTCIALSIAALLLTCMMDVHLFSFGPTILYSVLLAFLEGDDIRRNVDSRISLKKKRIEKSAD